MRSRLAAGVREPLPYTFPRLPLRLTLTSERSSDGIYYKETSGLVVHFDSALRERCHLPRTPGLHWRRPTRILARESRCVRRLGSGGRREILGRTDGRLVRQG